MHGTSEIFRKLASLHDAGVPCVCVTLIGAVGSVPQEVGAKMVVTGAGRVMGTVGGGRVEEAAMRSASDRLQCEGAPAWEVVEWNLQRDIGMTCGGVVRIAFETFHWRRWEVVIFGAGHVAQALTRVLQTLDCRVTVFDTRQEFLDALPVADNVIGQLIEPLESAVDTLRDDVFVVVMTQGHRTDLPVLTRLLRRGVFPYVGVIGSASKAAVLRRELREAGVADEALVTLRCPIGLPLGRDTPEEIAISIAAELLQVRGAG